MFGFDAGDVLDKISEKIEKMSPEECKAALTGGILGFGLAGALFEELEENKKDKKEDKRGYTPYRRNDYPSVCNEKRCIRDLPMQDYRNIRLVFQDREDAEEVLDDLRERLEESKDGYVTVRDLYSLADLPTNAAQLGWGWHDLGACPIERYGENYILRMPPAERLRK